MSEIGADGAGEHAEEKVVFEVIANRRDLAADGVANPIDMCPGLSLGPKVMNRAR